LKKQFTRLGLDKVAYNAQQAPLSEVRVLVRKRAPPEINVNQATTASKDKTITF
jgi:hypothetical protein